VVEILDFRNKPLRRDLRWQREWRPWTPDLKVKAHEVGHEETDVVTVSSLLDLYTVHLKMARDGITHPSEHALAFMQGLVEKLRGLETSEAIRIEESGNGGNVLGRFIRVASGELLAEIRIDPAAERLAP